MLVKLFGKSHAGNNLYLIHTELVSSVLDLLRIINCQGLTARQPIILLLLNDLKRSLSLASSITDDVILCYCLLALACLAE